MAWGNIIGAAIGATAQHIEGALNRRWSAKEARSADARAYAAWQGQTLNGPSLERQALQKAGYNPLLAINGGLSSTSMPSTHQGTSSTVPDVVGGAKQGAELANQIRKVWDDEDKQRKANLAKTQTETEIGEAAAKKIDAETKAVEQSTIESKKRTFLDNPIVGPIAGAVGIKAAEKIGGLVGGSAKDVNKAPIVKSWEKAAKRALRKGVPFIGSQMLRGLSLPLLFGTVGFEGFKRTDHQNNEFLRSADGFYPNGNWSR